MRVYPVITENAKKLPVYMTGIGVELKDSISRPCGFKEFQISYIEKGKGKFVYNGKSEYLYEGDCFVFRPNEPHSYEYITDDFCNLWITYDGREAATLTDYITQVGAEVFSVENPSEQKNFFEKIMKTASVTDGFFDEKCSSLVYSYIFQTACHKRNNRLGERRQRFFPVLEYMEKNYRSAIALDELASIAGLSRYRFCNSFKEAFGISVMKYLIKLRIQKSKEFLVSKDEKTVAEVSALTGFNDASYFCAVFKEYEGVTPNQFKKFQKK